MKLTKRLPILRIPKERSGRSNHRVITGCDRVGQLRRNDVIDHVGRDRLWQAHDA